ncbi:MAG: PKD domain-containing protein, partial [Chitinophagales bacterium]
ACPPTTVSFDNMSINATEFLWDFGFNGETSTAVEPSFTYTQAGTYEVMLIADDNNACNVADTAYTTVTIIEPDSLMATVTSEISCIDQTATFTAEIPTDLELYDCIELSWTFAGQTIGEGDSIDYTFTEPGDHQVDLVINTFFPNCPININVAQSVFLPPFTLAQFEPDPEIGCIPFTAEFNNTSLNATSFEWDFGDGSPTSTETNPDHFYPETGVYDVTLVAFDPTTCNMIDTFVTSVVAFDTVIVADFAFEIPDVCAIQTFNFTNELNPLLDYYWDFGDGNTSTDQNPNHVYIERGMYTVTMIASSPCAPADTAMYTFTLEEEPLVEGIITTPPQSGCFPLEVNVVGEGNGQSYYWNFGDGTIVEGLEASHVYENVGDYQVTFVAVDSMTCNFDHETMVFVSAFDYANADFTMSHEIIEVGYPVSFTNLSTNADSYLWDFDDGATSDETSPNHTYTQANEYEVCLTAMNNENCNDSTCLELLVIPPIVIGVPNAFSPNNDNVNDVLLVEGGLGIEFMELNIYNRWGELVFQTNDPNEGWDGQYEGNNQEMDVFVWTLVANLISGRQVSQHGNLSLVR